MEAQDRHWLRGGLPLSFLAGSEADSLAWRKNFIQTFLERDIPQLGIGAPASTLLRFWTMLAHYHGQLWNASQIAGSLGTSAPTVQRYLDILEDTFIVRRLPPYHANLKKRLIKSARVYVRDAGLLHTLLRNRTMEDLYSHPSLGNAWEGFVIEQILGLMPDDRQTCFYRTNAGAEIDLLLTDHPAGPVAIEIKYSLSPKVTKGFWNGYEDLKCRKGFIVYPGEEYYPIDKDVIALPIKDLRMIVAA
jgi:hypothetical protein